MTSILLIDDTPNAHGLTDLLSDIKNRFTEFDFFNKHEDPDSNLLPKFSRNIRCIIMHRNYLSNDNLSISVREFCEKNNICFIDFSGEFEDLEKISQLHYRVTLSSLQNRLTRFVRHFHNTKELDSEIFF